MIFCLNSNATSKSFPPPHDTIEHIHLLLFVPSVQEFMCTKNEEGAGRTFTSDDLVFAPVDGGMSTHSLMRPKNPVQVIRTVFRVTQPRKYAPANLIGGGGLGYGWGESGKSN